jgi:hypothetical protein
VASLDEAESSQGGFAALQAGWRTLSLDQRIKFTKYIRKVLPLDGYVFWLATEERWFHGALHDAADRRQNEDETLAVNRIIFTSTSEIEPFNEINPNTLWIGSYRENRFAFSQQGPFFKAAGQWHYSGDAVYPALESQLVELGQQLSDATLIVSNSLPWWLTLVDYAPIWLTPPNPGVTLYPSFLVPTNLRPPYGAVHIRETLPLGAEPVLGYNSDQWQLAADRVRVTLYGLTSDAALAFQILANQMSRDWGVAGMMEPAIAVDEKRPQVELGVLAMKKTYEFRVSYNQASMRRLARQMIETVNFNYVQQPFIAA